MGRSKRRTALILYCLLLVLPTAVLATLHWYQLRWDARETLEAMPAEARHAATRLGDALRARLHTLLESEDRRPWYHYRPMYAPPGSLGAEIPFLPSPFTIEPPVEGVLCRFSYDFDEGAEAPLRYLESEGAPTPDHDRLHQVARDLVGREWRNSFLRGTSPRSDLRREEFPLAVAVINSLEDPLPCIANELAALRELQGQQIAVRTFGFHLQLSRETDGTPFLYATRRVWIEPRPELAELPTCLSELAGGATFVDGFFLDPLWLLESLPAAMAEQVLGGSQMLLAPDSPAVMPGGDLEVVRLHPVEELQIETVDPADRYYSSMQVVISTARMKDHFRGQMLRFFGVAAMLSCSLGTGLWLLLASVRRDLEHARRTENFVSAVTHELRTPVAAIRLYAEMLRDGWVAEPDRQNEYHERIVSETQRLETMVERVLEKGRLVPGREKARDGDLSEAVAELCAEFESTGARDLVWELEEGLPDVRLDDEALHSILTNLVENARKYAPVPLGSPDEEKIRITTRLEDGRPVLEVSDRGPGIPDAEKQRVLRAFYRIGNEATRSSRGTGLGLHLVDLQARALGGGVTILDRAGGGATFRVHFQKSRAKG
ncbi:MAG: HAMP domain-containing histidine kinase [Planctomycetes bacterium]|nr:HAMP domain-containing histidine kinase [Planctomycetota bacterium]MCB9903613.1 HAMP domain-containing histidine kinase [Planctomycetota bacterium]